MIRLLLILLASTLLADDDLHLKPVDESASDPSFLAFRVHLLAALDRHDVAFVRSVTGDRDKVDETKIWTELPRILRLGVVKEEDEFIGPYVFTRLPKILDAYSNVALIRPDVKLRSVPKANGPVVEILHWDILQLQGKRRNGWTEVRAVSGKTGWVQESDVRSSMDYRAFFGKKNGKWMLMALVSGD